MKPAVKLNIRINIGTNDWPSYGSGLDISQTFDIAPVSFDDAVAIQKQFHDLGERLAQEFKPSGEQLAEVEKRARKLYAPA